MYREHIPLINSFAQRNEANLERMVMMVALSIRQPWHHVGVQLSDWAVNGKKSRFVWGNKLKTAEWLEGNITRLYNEAVASGDDPVKLMFTFLQVPGMGLAKAGFCCQLWNGSVGCIDSHNAANYDKFDEKMLAYNKDALPATRRRKVDAYIDWCAKRRSEFLWNRWTSIIAAKYPQRWADAEHVSAVHLEYLLMEGE